MDAPLAGLSAFSSSASATRPGPARRPPHSTSSSSLAPTTLSLGTASPRTAITQRDLDDPQLADDCISVDDPHHHYDFTSFMETWRLCDPRLPGLEQPSVHPERTRKDISRRQVEAGSVDMQGIRWELLGPRREQAAAARTILHPSPAARTIRRSSPTASFDTSAIQNPPDRTREPAFVPKPDERHYRFRAFLPKHKASVKHYQLRNLLAANSRNEVLYSTGNQVHLASLACPDLSHTVMDLSNFSPCSVDEFRITCLAASRCDSGLNGVVFAGSLRGDYAMLHLDVEGQRILAGEVTAAYNGLVTHIHSLPDRQSGLLQAVFCSNDRKVRLMDVKTMRFTNTFAYEYAINCSATSPDRRLRVTVGDSPEVLIADASSGQPLVSLRQQHDYGFACDWSKDGRYVAASAQDGRTVIWDARNWSESLCSLHSAISCPRSLHFTDHGALVVAENDDVVRVYDSACFDQWQDIQFFGSIAGVALLDGGAEMAIANADRAVGGLLTFERAVAPSGLGPGSFQGIYAPQQRFFRPGSRPHEAPDLVSDLMA